VHDGRDALKRRDRRREQRHQGHQPQHVLLAVERVRWVLVQLRVCRGRRTCAHVENVGPPSHKTPSTKTARTRPSYDTASRTTAPSASARSARPTTSTTAHNPDTIGTAQDSPLQDTQTPTTTAPQQYQTAGAQTARAARSATRTAPTARPDTLLLPPHRQEQRRKHGRRELAMVHCSKHHALLRHRRLRRRRLREADCESLVNICMQSESATGGCNSDEYCWRNPPNTLTDDYNCGTCGNACNMAAGSWCDNGVCCGIDGNACTSNANCCNPGWWCDITGGSRCCPDNMIWNATQNRCVPYQRCTLQLLEIITLIVHNALHLP